MDGFLIGGVELLDASWADWKSELPWMLLAIVGLYALLYLVDAVLRPKERALPMPQAGKAEHAREILHPKGP